MTTEVGEAQKINGSQREISTVVNKVEVEEAHLLQPQEDMIV